MYGFRNAPIWIRWTLVPTWVFMVALVLGGVGSYVINQTTAALLALTYGLGVSGLLLLLMEGSDFSVRLAGGLSYAIAVFTGIVGSHALVGGDLELDSWLMFSGGWLGAIVLFGAQLRRSTATRSMLGRFNLITSMMVLAGYLTSGVTNLIAIPMAVLSAAMLLFGARLVLFRGQRGNIVSAFHTRYAQVYDQIETLRAHGVGVSEAASLLSKARNAYNLSKTDESMRELSLAEESAVRQGQYFNDTVDLLADFDRVIEEAEGLGADVEDISNRRDRACDEIDYGSYLEAQSIIRYAKRDATELVEYFPRSEAKIKEADDLIETARSAEVVAEEAQTALNDAREAAEAREYKTAFDFARLAIRKATEAMDQSDRSGEDLSETRALVEDARDRGRPVGEMLELVEKAAQAVGKSNYSLGAGLLASARRGVKEMDAAHERVQLYLENIPSLLARSTELSAAEQVTQEVDQARGQYESGNYVESARAFEKIENWLNEQDSTYSEVREVIAVFRKQVLALVDNPRMDAADKLLERARRLLETAESHLAAHDYGEALGVCEELDRTVEKLNQKLL